MNKNKQDYNVKSLVIFSIILELIMYILMPYIEVNFKVIISIIFIYIIGTYFFFIKKENCNLFSIIFIVALLIRTIYIFATDINVRQHDVGKITNNGHLAYIYTLFMTHRLPLTNKWQFYHPPLWHIIGAIWLHISNLYKPNLHNMLEGLQILSLWFSAFTVLIVDRINIKLKIKNKYRYIIDLLVAFHPTLIYFSGSINNDCLLLCLESLIILLLLNFYEDTKWKNIIYLAIVTGLCVMTKANGAMMAIPIIYVFIDRFIYVIKNKKNIKEYILKILTFGFLSLPIGLWHPIRNIIKFGSTKVPEPGDWLYTGNHSVISRFLSINYHELFHFADMDNDYNMMAHIIKTALFGEDKYTSVKVLADIMLVLSIILIVISLIFMIKYLLKDKKNIYINVLLITWISYMVSMYIFNYKYPFSCSMDFRYIAICLLPGIIIIGYQLEKLRNKYLRIVIEILCYLFILSSIIFIFLI